MRLKDKVVIITGAGQGIGAAYARKFAEEGARVVLADINQKKSEEVLKEITKLDATMSPQIVERFWLNRKPIVHVLAYYRLKLKELSEVLQEGSLDALKPLL